MCLRKSSDSTKMKTPSKSSPWRRHVQSGQHQSQPITKPRLSRKIISSARVNLNAYWSKFEQMSKCTAIVTFDPAITVKRSLTAGTLMIIDNEINENLANEMKELAN